jgi:uncharacterized protein (DUF697 family)
MGCQAVSQVLIGSIPSAGNAINTTTAASITEAIGCAANSYITKDDA